LFLANRLVEALDALAEQTLEQSGEANLLAGLIYLYHPQIDGEAAKLHFERAGALGIAHAYTILGNMALDEGCTDCAARALLHFARALESGHDAEASFGLALALYKTGGEEAAQKQLTDLLSAATPTPIRVLATSMLGAMLLKQEPNRAEELLLSAASEGEPAAQAGLGLILLRRGRAAEAEDWLARAVALRSELARSWYDSQPSDRQFRILVESSTYLKHLREQPTPYLSDAISWCARLSTADFHCLTHASEQHHVCTITLGTAIALQINHFPGSDVYHACRLRERFGAPPEGPDRDQD
jgi:TPR repeat protein